MRPSIAAVTSNPPEPCLGAVHEIIAAYSRLFVHNSCFRRATAAEQRRYSAASWQPASGSRGRKYARCQRHVFRSDITVMNLANHDSTVVIDWLPRVGGNATTTVITIPKQSGIRSSDFVAEYLHQAGLGAIRITAVTSEGVDVEGALYVSSRIWSPQPGTSGTTSQSLPAVTLGNAFYKGVSARLFGVGSMENVANYRVNVGIVNMEHVPSAVEI